MTVKTRKIEKIEIHPLTPERWADFETVFGPNGAWAKCWCMWWRMSNKEFTTAKGEERHDAMRSVVQAGKEPGLIAYADGVPAGWAAVAPRADYPRLQTSKNLAPVDDQPVWSIPCFFIHRNYRRQHLMERLIEAACEYARDHGARILEAYPLDVEEKTRPSNVYTGVTVAFERAGFEVAARREYRPVMRKNLV
ncbi:MAG: GNAT family N-acetyltransferase [Anaerolineaceae bacterium]